MTGHLLGASGGVEFVATALSIQNDVIHPTINYEDPDPECNLNYTPNTAVKRTVRYAMSNSFGFGGHNASLVVGKYEPA
jgi:3-oxoacyl-[acyl-carrier-protein] synthase II